MTRVLHLLDQTCDWEQRVECQQLADRLPSTGLDVRLASLGRSAEFSAVRQTGHSIGSLPPFVKVAALAAPFVAQWSRRHSPQVIHAWSVEAAAAGSATGVPVVLRLFDAALVAHSAKLIRSIGRAGSLAIACSSETVRRRLVESGVPIEQCVVIRPGVDFGSINRWKRGTLRERLGVARHEMLAVLPQPVTRSGGHREATLATAMTARLQGCLRLLIPGDSAEARRLLRLAAGLPGIPAYAVPCPNQNYEEVLSVADVVLVPAHGDCSTTAIAWAMAANVAVIGAAVHAVAELIAHRTNGLLYKRSSGRSAIPSIAKLLTEVCRADRARAQPDARTGFVSREALADSARKRVDVNRLREVAHGHAYECFGVRRMAEQYATLYRNVLAGAPPAQGITDSAMIA